MTATSILIPVRPCIQCGACDRDKRGNCKLCIKAVVLAWRAANPDRVKATKAAWLAKNLEKCKAYRDTYNAANVEKEKARGATYRANNRHKIKAYDAAWYKTQGAAYYAANADRCNANAAKWDKANPEAIRIIKHNRRARQRENGGVLSKGLLANLFKLQKGKCACCSQTLGDEYHLDHIMPIARGGSNTDDNMQLLRKRCNLQKNAKHPIDFMQSRGFLL